MCVATVFCRTNHEVISDFEPVFRERHSEFRAIEQMFLVQTHPILDSFINNTMVEKNDMIIVLREADEKVSDEIATYLEGKPFPFLLNTYFFTYLIPLISLSVN